MKVIMGRFMTQCEYVLSAVGMVAFGYCALVYSTQIYFQSQNAQSVPADETTLLKAAIGTSSRSEAIPSARRESEPIGKLEIPRIHLSSVFAEGVTSRVLRVAIGHVPGAALPGQPGNVALVAHRDTFFRRLGELQPGDEIRLAISGAEYTYHVTFTEIVSPRETWVLQPATGEILTLVTCYPFHYVGAAPKRFVVRARRQK